MVQKFTDESGKIYGELTVLSAVRENGRFYWLCKCSCGALRRVASYNLRSGQSKSCGKCGKIRKDANPLEPAKRMYRAMKTGAARRNLSFEITFEQFLELSGKKCNYCGQPPETKFAYTRKRYSQNRDVELKLNGLDRVDSNQGYFLQNVVPCCRLCNTMKLDQTLEEFYERVGRIYERAKIIEGC